MILFVDFPPVCLFSTASRTAVAATTIGSSGFYDLCLVTYTLSWCIMNNCRRNAWNDGCLGLRSVAVVHMVIYLLLSTIC